MTASSLLAMAQVSTQSSIRASQAARYVHRALVGAQQPPLGQRGDLGAPRATDHPDPRRGRGQPSCRRCFRGRRGHSTTARAVVILMSRWVTAVPLGTQSRPSRRRVSGLQQPDNRHRRDGLVAVKEPRPAADLPPAVSPLSGRRDHCISDLQGHEAVIDSDCHVGSSVRCLVGLKAATLFSAEHVALGDSPGGG
jgi:hypothetical protein